MGNIVLHVMSTDNAFSKGANFTNISSEFPITQTYRSRESVAKGGISASSLPSGNACEFPPAHGRLLVEVSRYPWSRARVPDSAKTQTHPGNRSLPFCGSFRCENLPVFNI